MFKAGIKAFFNLVANAEGEVVVEQGGSSKGEPTDAILRGSIKDELECDGVLRGSGEDYPSGADTVIVNTTDEGFLSSDDEDVRFFSWGECSDQEAMFISSDSES